MAIEKIQGEFKEAFNPVAILKPDGSVWFNKRYFFIEVKEMFQEKEMITHIQFVAQNANLISAIGNLRAGDNITVSYVISGKFMGKYQPRKDGGGTEKASIWNEIKAIGIETDGMNQDRGDNGFGDTTPKKVEATNGGVKDDDDLPF